jgi:hypothetical protein
MQENRREEDKLEEHSQGKKEIHPRGRRKLTDTVLLETGTATSGFYLRIAIGLASLFTAIRSRGYFLDRLGDLF